MSRCVPVVFGVLLLSLSLILCACERTQHIHARCTTEVEPTAGAGLVPGERVVARFRDAFHEATVITVQGKLVTIAWDEPPPERAYLPRDWVASFEELRSPRQGEWALCWHKVAWQLCRVEHLGDGKVTASLSSDGSQVTLPPRRCLTVPGKLRGWAEERGPELLRLARREAAFKGARPATAGRPAKPGDRVLAEWMQNSWWEATVVGQAEAGITVKWVAGGGEQTVTAEQVAPLYGLRGAQIGPETPVFCASSGTSWAPAWVDSATSTMLQVSYAGGSKGSVPRKDCVPAVLAAEESK